MERLSEMIDVTKITRNYSLIKKHLSQIAQSIIHFNGIWYLFQISWHHSIEMKLQTQRFNLAIKMRLIIQFCGLKWIETPNEQEKYQIQTDV